MPENRFTCKRFLDSSSGAVPWLYLHALLAQKLGSKNLSPRLNASAARGSGSNQEWLPGVMAHSALLWLEIPIQITGKWWSDKRIEVLA